MREQVEDRQHKVSIIRSSFPGTLIALAIGWVAPSGPALASNNAINLAADRIITVFPPPMPQQKILIGTHNGATASFSWLLPESYPPGTPEYKKPRTAGGCNFDMPRILNPSTFNIDSTW